MNAPNKPVAAVVALSVVVNSSELNHAPEITRLHNEVAGWHCRNQRRRMERSLSDVPDTN